MHLNETTRAYFERVAELEGDQTAADMRAVLVDKPDPSAMSFVRLAANPVYNAQLRATCVATMLQGGHAVNALPQLARAQVNCRIMPGEPVEDAIEPCRKTVEHLYLSPLPRRRGKNEKAPEGTPVMHVNGFVRGKGKFVVTEYIPTDERTGPRFPLLLTTGRILTQYNVGAQTRRTANSLWHEEDRLEERRISRSAHRCENRVAGRLARRDAIPAPRPDQASRPRSGRRVEVERGSGLVARRNHMYRRDL